MQALALKYRPKNYEELIGQESVSKSLSHALDSKRLSHAYLFSGLRGSGKTSSARIFAKALVCEHGPTSKPCEVCANCKMANESRHIDIIEMDGASHRKIDDIRDLIEQTKYAPAVARYKIFIIDEVHMLTKEAFNALLKTLEEPPEYVKFILATTDPLKLPVTVLSRTQHFRFKPIAKNMVIKHLAYILENEGIQYETPALEIIARSGSGSLRDSITLLDQAIIFSSENITQSAVASMLGLLDPSKIDEILDIVLKQDRDRAIVVIKELENYDPETIIDEMIANIKNRFLAKEPKFSLLMYERFFRILSEAKGMLFVGADSGFALAMTLFLMMEAVNLRSIDDIIESAKSLNSADTDSQNVAKSNNQKEQDSIKAVIAPLDSIKISPYDKFLSGIYDRDFDLGECFKKDIEFIKFQDNTLFVISHAKGANKELLRGASKAIMSVLKATFNQDTKIKIDPPKEENASEPTKDVSINLDKDMQNLDKLNVLISEDRGADLKKKSSELFNELKNSNSFVKESKEESVLKELEKLFGAPKVEDN
ncbi:DNA polymerase III subunit gamma/tau [Campylobacter geochelonis]|uniref:DNA polymerase III subunit gamma/tau n=1 Tax=Campylobacter geochelonis TaxID=1780362 RepID=UPI00077075BF|nr:DNA polymerase III subunit gamma/tau [Campylobacter geochelonis]CZE47119.1 DNA polymerase III subunit gamma/tau [Campylobacter geochelonis]CZE51014.1 DNA polymerase III subunit gamma/tau [Campylobacter geochelonis]